MIAIRTFAAVVALSCLAACSDEDGTTPTCDDDAVYTAAHAGLNGGSGGAGGDSVSASDLADTADKPADGDCFTKPGHAATLVGTTASGGSGGAGDDSSDGGSGGSN